MHAIACLRAADCILADNNACVRLELACVVWNCMHCVNCMLCAILHAQALFGALLDGVFDCMRGRHAWPCEPAHGGALRMTGATAAGPPVVSATRHAVAEAECRLGPSLPQMTCGKVRQGSACRTPESEMSELCAAGQRDTLSRHRVWRTGLYRRAPDIEACIRMRIGCEITCIMSVTTFRVYTESRTSLCLVAGPGVGPSSSFERVVFTALQSTQQSFK